MALPLLLLGYLLGAHFAATREAPQLAALALAGLLLAALWSGLRRGRRSSWLALLILLPAIAALSLLDGARQLLYLPPVLINLGLLVVFGRSLLPGNTPLIERIAVTMGDAATPELARYTRRVTQAWCVFFVVLAVESVLLALYADPRIWSLFANGLNYVFLALFFVIEYQVRLRCLPEQTHEGFFGFIARLARLDPRRQSRS